MKLSTIGLAGVALVALAACNTEQAANDSAENTTIEATNSAAGAENVTDGDKPANEAAAGDQTSTGDKPADESTEAPADDAPADDSASGDKPVE